jgi:hypothetical protein
VDSSSKITGEFDKRREKMNASWAKYIVMGQIYNISCELGWEKGEMWESEVKWTDGMSDEEEEAESVRVEKILLKVLKNRVELYEKLVDMEYDEQIEAEVVGTHDYWYGMGEKRTEWYENAKKEVK